MPISEESNKISYNTDGLIREFSFNFKFLQPSNIKVSFWPKDDKDNSTKSVELEEGRDYTLIYDDAEEGGFVVLTESSAEEQAQGKPKYPATPTSGTLLVARIMPLDQQAHIRPVSGFPEEVITNTFDKLVMIDQQQQEQLDRCVKVSDVSDINPEVLVQQVERIHAGIEDIVVVADHIEDVEYIAANGEDILKASEDSLANVNAAKEQANIATEQAARAESYSQSCHNMLEDSREARDVAIEQAGISTAQASVAAEQANIATEQANIVKEQKIIVEQLSQATNDIFLEAQSIEQKVSQDLEVSKGYAQTALTQAGVATEQAGIATTQADIATARADEIKQYAANASISEANALNYASEASASAYNSEISERASATSATNSKIWAEGTDEEVQALGGVHSSKTWAEIGSNVGGKWGNILGDIKDQSDLQAVLDKKLENQSRFKDALSIGKDNIDGGLATTIGFRNDAVYSSYGVLMGYDNYANGTNNVCIGKWCETSGDNSICIGYSAATAEQNSIQLGEGFNTIPNSFQVGEHQLLNIETGKIPIERLPDDIGGSVDLTDYVKNTDYATTSSVGLVKVAAATGINVNKEGKIYISKAPDESIVAKTEQYRPLTPSNIDLAVKTGITTNTIELTDDEKTNAKNWLGISEQGGSGHELFDIVQKDHILNYEETQGYELLGSYVYKTAVAGSRYGYPDFYNKVVEEYNASTSKHFKKYKSSNITNNGVMDKSGVLSGFGASQYASNAFVSVSKMELVVKFTMGEDNTTQQTIVGAETIYDGMTMYLLNGYLTVYVSSNGTSWNVANKKAGTHLFIPYKTYLVKYKYIETGYHKFYISEDDGQTWTEDISISSSNLVFSGYHNLGIDSAKDYPFLGTIDLKGCYLIDISSNGKYNWQGCNYYEFDYKEYSNGHKFFDITNKEPVDEFYNATGTAWFYGVDEANERILLPRNDYYFKNGDLASVGSNIEAGLPNIEGSYYAKYGIRSTDKTTSDGCITSDNNSSGWIGGSQQSGYASSNLGIDASLYNTIYGNSDTVQPASVSVLAYMVVGNVETTQGYSEVVAQGKEILEQVNEGINEGIKTRADIRLSNVTPNASFRRDSVRWGIPDYEQMVEIETVSNATTTYAAVKDGIVWGKQISGTTAKIITINGKEVHSHKTSSGTWSHPFFFPLYQGDIIVVENTTFSVAANNRMFFAPFRE